MLANGPVCTKIGEPSRDCSKVGSTASLRSTITAPVTPMSSVVTGLPSLSNATTILLSLSLRSFKSVAKAKTAIISLATEIEKLVSRVRPFSVGDCPIVIFRKNLSFKSTTVGEMLNIKICQQYSFYVKGFNPLESIGTNVSHVRFSKPIGINPSRFKIILKKSRF